MHPWREWFGDAPCPVDHDSLVDFTLVDGAILIGVKAVPDVGTDFMATDGSTYQYTPGDYDLQVGWWGETIMLWRPHTPNSDAVEVGRDVDVHEAV